jgi:hypothetical protein
MWRKCALGVVAAIAAFMTLPVMASAASTNDTAKGVGVTTAFPSGGDPAGPAPARVSFDAHSNFNGTEPGGSMSVTIGANTWAGDVTCLQVTGGFAEIAGYIERAQGQETFNGVNPVSFDIQVTDNGSTGDEMMFSMGPDPIQFNSCTPQAFSGFMDQAVVTVKDG